MSWPQLHKTFGADWARKAAEAVNFLIGRDLALTSDVTDLTSDVGTLQTFAELFDNFGDFADDGAAASGGVEVGQFYHTSGAVKVRVT